MHSTYYMKKGFRASLVGDEIST